LLRLGLLVIGLLYPLDGINFIFQVLAVLGILPFAQPVPIYQLDGSLGNALGGGNMGCFFAGLAYLIGLAVSWKHLSIKPSPAVS
jgi:hypothetical protein